MTTFLLLAAFALCCASAFLVWCCLAVGKLADVQEAERETCIGDSWCLHRNGEFFVVVAYIRGHTFAWSYRRGFELMVMNTIWHHYELGLLNRDEAAAIGEMVAGSSLGVSV